MKTKFKYKFTPWFIAVFVIALVFGLGCVVFNVIRFLQLLKSENASSYSYISSVISVIVGILAYVFILPALFDSAYIIENDTLISKWGFLKNKLEIKDMTMVTHFKKTDKLVIYFADESFVNICIDKSEFDDFVDSLKSVNKKIFFEIDSDKDKA